MSAKKGKATWWGCATFASNRRWQKRLRLSWWWMAPAPTTSPRRRWAAGDLKLTSPVRADIAGAITDWAIRYTRFAAQSRCFRKTLGWFAQIGCECGLDRGWIEREC